MRPPPPVVPREMVTYSRMVLLSPISTLVGSPAYLRSCGAMPMQVKEKMRLLRPMVRWPSRTTWEMSSQSSPRTTLGPMVQKGPTLQLAGIWAPSATIAVGWMLTLRSRPRLRLCLDFLGDAGDDLAHDGGVADEFAVDGDAAGHLDGAAAPVQDGDFDAELVAGGDGAAEAGVFNAGEDHELGVAVGDLGEEKSAAGLGDGFDHEDAGHDGVAGEVALEELLVDGDVLDGDDALVGLHLDDAVDEEEGVAVRQEGHDFEDVHRLGRGCGTLRGVWWGFAHGMDEYKRRWGQRYGSALRNGRHKEKEAAKLNAKGAEATQRLFEMRNSPWVRNFS